LAIVLHFKSELWKLRQFSMSPWDLWAYNHFAVEKVGGSCSHLGAIGPRVSGALAPRALWLQCPCRRPEMGPRPGLATATPGGGVGRTL